MCRQTDRHTNRMLPPSVNNEIIIYNNNNNIIVEDRAIGFYLLIMKIDIITRS